MEYNTVYSGFSVNDLEMAQGFYSKTLSLNVKKNTMGILKVTSNKGISFIIYPNPHHRAAEFTILNFEVPNIEEAVAHLKSKGVIFKKYTEPIKTDEDDICRNPKGPKIAWFEDPAGNILSLIETREPS